MERRFLLFNSAHCMYEAPYDVNRTFRENLEALGEALDIDFFEYYGYEIHFDMEGDTKITLRSAEIVKIRTMLINEILN